jgi:hypothetical protein
MAEPVRIDDVSEKFRVKELITAEMAAARLGKR